MDGQGIMHTVSIHFKFQIFLTVKSFLQAEEFKSKCT